MTLYIIGTGPGDIAHMSGRAVEIIRNVECVAGYTTYLDMIADIIRDKEIISTGMMKEV
ncbi:MAG: SAM-dependent methyltransferase, partial [Desulfobacula sp.]